MNRRSIEAGRGHVTIGLRNRIKKGARGVQQSLDKLSMRMRGLGVAGSAAGLAISTPIAFATKKFADFDDKMRLVGAVSKATNAELTTLTETAKDLGRTTSFTAEDVAALMIELGRAGFNPAEVDKMTSSVLNLARATGTDAALAAASMSTTLKEFGMGASDAESVADMLTATANGTFNSVETLTESLGYAGKVAKDFNVPLEETLAILGSLGNVGIQGSMAGTAMRRLLTLSGAEAKRLNAIFGVEFKDAAGNARPLIDVLDEVAQATNGLGTADRAAKFNEAFGLLGITGASVIADTAAETRKLRDEIKASGGIAEKTATQMDAGLGGSFRKIMSAAEGVQIAIGESLAEPLQYVTDLFTGGLSGVTEFIEDNQTLVQAVAATGAGLTVMGGGLLAAGSVAAISSVAIGGLASTAALLATPLGVAGVAAAGLAGHFVVSGEALDWFMNRFGPLVETVQNSVSGITAAISNGNWDAVWEIGVETMELVWLEMTQGIRDRWTELSTAIVDTGGAMAQSVGSIFVELGNYLETLLDYYKSYYDSVYNGIVETLGELNGVQTIGGQSSAFEANYDEQGFRDRIDGIRDFGRAMEDEATASREANKQAGASEIVDREKRIKEMRESINSKSNQQTIQKEVREATQGFNLKGALDAITGATGSPEQRKAAEDAVMKSAMDAMPVTEGGQTTGTFSAQGALLAGLGQTKSPDQQVATNTQRTVQVLEKIQETLAGGVMGQVVEVVNGIAADPVDAVRAGAESVATGALDFASGLAGMIANQDLIDFGAQTDPPKPEAEGQRETNGLLAGLTGILETIADNTEDRPTAVYGQ